jgi:hypothetical protein
LWSHERWHYLQCARAALAKLAEADRGVLDSPGAASCRDQVIASKPSVLDAGPLRRAARNALPFVVDYLPPLISIGAPVPGLAYAPLFLL